MVLDLLDTAIGAGVGVFVGAYLYRVGAQPQKWELDVDPVKNGVTITARKGTKKLELHKVGYDRAKTRSPEQDFDEKFAEALAHSKSTIRSLNAATDRKRLDVGS